MKWGEGGQNPWILMNVREFIEGFPGSIALVASWIERTILHVLRCNVGE